MQIRTAKSTIEETCSKVDTELEKLSRLKHSTEKAVRELEIRAISACTGADKLAELGPKGTKQANNAVSILQKKEQQLRNAMQTTKEKVCTHTATLDCTRRHGYQGILRMQSQCTRSALRVTHSWEFKAIECAGQ